MADQYGPVFLNEVAQDDPCDILASTIGFTKKTIIVKAGATSGGSNIIRWGTMMIENADGTYSPYRTAQTPAHNEATSVLLAFTIEVPVDRNHVCAAYDVGVIKAANVKFNSGTDAAAFDWGKAQKFVRR